MGVHARAERGGSSRYAVTGDAAQVVPGALNGCGATARASRTRIAVAVVVAELRTVQVHTVPAVIADAVAPIGVDHPVGDADVQAVFRLAIWASTG